MKQFLLILSLVAFVQSDNHSCGEGEVRVWEEGRFVCEPESVTVAVFESNCIEKIEVTKDSRIFMQLTYDGKLDKDNWKSEHLKLVLKENCAYHFEKVKVHQ